MPKIPCPHGRTKIRGGKVKPVWHNPDGSGSQGDPDGKCPVCYKAPSQPVPDAPTPEAPPKETAPPPKPEAPVKKPGFMAKLGFGSRETSPEVAVAPPKNPEPSYFVDASHTIKFANLIYGAGRWGFDTFDRFAMTKEAGLKTFTEKHPELLTLSDFEKDAIKLDPETDMWGRFATGFTRMIGCKTQAQAHSAIATMDLLGHFGALIGFGAEHIWASWKAGKPYRDAKRQAKKLAIATRKEVSTHGRDSTEGTGGDLPQVRPGTPAAAT